VTVTVRIREATDDDLSAVLSVLDGAMLAVTPDDIRDGETLVATDDGRVLGALVLDEGEIEAVAMRRARRGQGIGTALVTAAAERHGRLTAEFDPDVRPFYDSLGFAVESADAGDDRLRGIRPEPEGG